MDVLLDIRKSFLHNKSSDKALSKLTYQVTQIILALESLQSLEDFDNLADQIASLSQQLVLSVKELIKAAQIISKDQDELEMSINTLVSSSQSLIANMTSLSNRLSYTNIIREVVDYVYQMFAAIENIDKSRIKSYIHQVQRCLTDVNTAKTLEKLTFAFKVYTETLLLLLNQVAKYQRDAKSGHRRQAIGNAAILLKRVASSINKSFQLCLRYPNNINAQEMKASVTAEINAALDSLSSAVMDEKPEGRETSSTGEGRFVCSIDQILDYLKNEEKQKQLCDGEFECLIEAAIKHSMSVASLSSRSDEQRQLVMHSSQRVLTYSEKVVRGLRNCLSFPSLKQNREDFLSYCDSMIHEVHSLERHVNSLLIHQIVDTFKETTEPLDRLIEASLTGGSAGSEEFNEEFNQHADRMYQVASLAADSSNNIESVGQIEDSISALEKLDPDILPAIVQVKKKPTFENIEVLKHVRHRWTREIKYLTRLISDMSDTVVFLEVTDVQLRRYCSQSLELIASHDFDIHVFAESVRAQTGLCQHLISVLQGQRSRGDNSSREHITQICDNLAEVISGVKSAANRLFMYPHDSQVREAFSKRIQLLQKALQLLLSAYSNDLSDDDFLPQLKDIGFRNKLVEETDLTNNDIVVEIIDVSMDEVKISEGAEMWLSLPVASKKANISNRQTANPSGDYRDLHFSLNMSSSYDDPELPEDISVSLHQLTEEIIMSVLSCDQKSANQLVDKLSMQSNLCLDMANSVIPTLPSIHEGKQMMKHLVSNLSSLAVKFTSVTLPSALADISNCDLVRTQLLDISRSIDKLNAISDQITKDIQMACADLHNAISLKNNTYFQKELDKFLKLLSSIDAVIKDNQKSLGFVQTELQSYRLAKNSLCNLLKTTGYPESDEAKNSFRAWAIALYALISTVKQNADVEIKSTCNHCLSDYSDCLQVTMKLKQHLSILVKCEGHDMKKARLREILALIDPLLSQMLTPEGTIEPIELAARLQTDLLSVRLASQISEFYKTVDELVEPMSSKLNELANKSIRCGEKNATDAFWNDYMTSQAKVENDIDLICEDLKKSAKIEGGSESKVTLLAHQGQKFLKSVDKLSDADLTDEILSDYKIAQRELVISLLNIKQNMASRKSRSGLLSAVLSTSDTSTTHTTDAVSSLLTVSHNKVPSSSAPTASKISYSSATSIHLQQQEREGHPLSSAMKIGSAARETPFSRAVRLFQGDVNRWIDDDNAVVQAAKELSSRLSDMHLYIKELTGPIRSREELYKASCKIVELTKTITEFTQVIIKYSLADKRLLEDLIYNSNQIPFYAEQLALLTNVKRSTDEFDLTVSVLLTNAQNLIRSITKSLDATEALLIKGLNEPPEEEYSELQMFGLATRWRASLLKFRRNQALYSEYNDLGLRVISKQHMEPHLTEICQTARL